MRTMPAHADAVRAARSHAAAKARSRSTWCSNALFFSTMKRRQPSGSIHASHGFGFRPLSLPSGRKTRCGRRVQKRHVHEGYESAVSQRIHRTIPSTGGKLCFVPRMGCRRANSGATQRRACTWQGWYSSGWTRLEIGRRRDLRGAGAGEDQQTPGRAFHGEACAGYSTRSLPSTIRTYRSMGRSVKRSTRPLGGGHLISSQSIRSAIPAPRTSRASCDER
jgi:hypothetical protein